MAGLEMRLTPKTDATKSRLGTKTQYKKPEFFLMSSPMTTPFRKSELQLGCEDEWLLHPEYVQKFIGHLWSVRMIRIPKKVKQN
jgi:hypothetical protein